MRVSTSPDFLESVANDPEILPSVSEDGSPVRFGKAWDDCIGLEWPEGGFVFHRRDPVTFEVHTLFRRKTPDTDGKAREALAFMFGAGAGVLLTQVAKDLSHVRRFAMRHGFRKFDEGPWRDVGADYFILTREDWQGCPPQSSPQQ